MINRPGGAGPMQPGGQAAGAQRRQPGGWMGMAGPPAPKLSHPGKTLRQLLGRLKPELRNIGAVAVLAVGSVTFAVIGPKIIGNATNIIFDVVVGKVLPAGLTKAQAIALLQARGQGQVAQLVSGMNVTPGQGIDFTALGMTLLLAVGVYLLSSVLLWGQGYIMAGVAQRTVYGLRRDVEAKLSRLPLKYFDSHSHGDILSRVTNDIDNIATTLQQSLSQIVTSVLTVIGVLAVMIWISPLLAVISLVTVPLSVGVTLLIARRSQKQFAAQWKWTGSLNGHVEEMHTGHALVQVFGRRAKAQEIFDGHNRGLYEASFRAQFLSGVIQPAIQFLANLNYVAIAVIGGFRVASGTLTLGDVQAFIQYSRQFTMPIMQVAGQLNLLQSGLASAERVFELLEAEEETADLDTGARLGDTTGEVELEHVNFRYVPDQPLILDFNLRVSPGQTIAIVGPTGAGKTTIVNLLMRFYDIDSGRISLDGVDTGSLPRDEVRRAFGMVLQDTWLFAGTIRDNIAYGKEGATDDEIIAAAQAAHVDSFVRTLPKGYATVLDEDGSDISSGQRQLLTIARAFLADPSILILDEATSNVDTRTEVLIQKAMAQLRQGRTSFVIAHRLSTIRNADTIVVMDGGKIVEQGSHAELLRREGFYYRLYKSQFTEAWSAGGDGHAVDQRTLAAVSKKTSSA
ncbi:MAG TPA: ABC transporter ATP-binding protein [Candidatus Limnocylindrales bacterium]|nr:ABC transporter ATP-binding protein [Candidatus Limnocylindrales bacterium]